MEWDCNKQRIKQQEKDEPYNKWYEQYKYNKLCTYHSYYLKLSNKVCQG